MQNPLGLWPVVLAVALFALLPLCHMAIIKISRKPERSITFMFISFGIYYLFWITLYCRLDQADRMGSLGFLGGSAAVWFLNLGYAEAFSMLCRGFSLHLILDVYNSGRISGEDAISRYGGGKGIGWMMEKRVRSMMSLGLVDFDGTSLKVKSSSGVMIGWVGLAVKRALKMGKGG